MKMRNFGREREFWLRKFERKRSDGKEMRERYRVFAERKDGSWRVRENVKR